MIYLAESKTSKIILFLSFISILISTLKYLSLKFLFIQIIIFYFFISSTDCNIYGRCYYTGYFNLLIVFVITLFLLFDYFGVFNQYKRVVRRLYSYYESSNSSSLKEIIFADENQISDYYKNRKIPKLFNKNFKHKSIDEELTEDDKNSINKQNQNLLNNNNKTTNVNKYIGLSS